MINGKMEDLILFEDKDRSCVRSTPGSLCKVQESEVWIWKAA